MQGSRYQLPASPVNWGERRSRRGPIVVNIRNVMEPNAIGAHGGPYAIHAALGEVTGQLAKDHRPDLRWTLPREIPIKASDNWFNPAKIVTLDPLGHLVSQIYHRQLSAGADIRPTIAMTPAYIHMPETKLAIDEGYLHPDGELLSPNGMARVWKMSIDPVWHLPGVAHRLNVDEGALRQGLVEGTNGAYPALVTQPDIEVYLPGTGGTSLYVFGDPRKLGHPDVPHALRVHDECNGSDTFGATICTCRPFLAHGVNVCIETAQQGGVGVIAFNRKEGRGLGEVVKLLVYNARSNQPGGDAQENYFARTKAVAGVEDLRLQALMPDPLHWLGINRVDKLLSMSPDKFSSITQAGIEVVERVALPDYLVPQHAATEFGAKIARGYRGEACKAA